MRKTNTGYQYISKTEKGFVVHIPKEVGALHGGQKKLKCRRLVDAVRKRNKMFGFDPDNLVHEKGGPKILIIDIETAPVVAYVWGLWNQNIAINQVKDDWYILCFGYMWLTDAEATVVSLPDYKGYTQGRAKEKYLAAALYEVLDEADIVVAHNARRFDVQRIMAKFLEYNLPEPAPFKIVDTLQIVRGNFNLTSAKLDFVAKFLDVGRKLEHVGMPLWIGCMNGDDDSWQQMCLYNKQDVELLKHVYLMVRRWDKRHPNVALYYNDSDTRCVVCGGTELSPTGQAHTPQNTYEALRCDTCGKVQRGKKTLLDKIKRANQLVNVKR